MTLSLADIRLNYTRQGLSEADCADDPLVQLQRWVAEAVAAPVDEPTAMTLSTLESDGRLAARVVLLKGIESGQLHFYTNYHSRKGRALAAHPQAALTFFWPALERQIRAEGLVTRLPEAVSDAYFASRPRGSQLGAWASTQSEPIATADALQAQMAAWEAQYPDVVPRPPHWGGYAFTPDRLEFWQGRPNRLHDRLQFTREAAGWQRRRLQP